MDEERDAHRAGDEEENEKLPGDRQPEQEVGEPDEVVVRIGGQQRPQEVGEFLGPPVRTATYTSPSK
ncbi:MAG: hypothetical protein U5K28_05200 [Halobacteriales archaeon]|nr:hypothetical protein [Halobacteriales archaeon]